MAHSAPADWLPRHAGVPGPAESPQAPQAYPAAIGAVWMRRPRGVPACHPRAVTERYLLGAGSGFAADLAGGIPLYQSVQRDHQ